MRWIYFLLITYAAVLVQTTVGQVLWLPTPAGWIAPVFLAAMAVFVAMFVRSRVDALLAAWTLGMATDLTLSGSGMGLLALLFLAGAWGVYNLREAFFCERVATQVIMALLFCLFVFETWAVYQVLLGDLPGGQFARLALQAAGISVYTAAVTPLICAALRRMQRVLMTFPSGRGRERR